MQIAACAKRRRLRWKASKSLQGLDQIARVLKSGSRDQQIRAIYALEQVLSPKVFPPLVAALNSQEADVRSAALQVLGKKQNVKVLKYMVRHLKDPHPAVRIHAAEALGNFSDRRLTPFLTALLQESDEELVKSAVRSLAPRRPGGRGRSVGVA
ncbi:MAG: HEAT repeat domain-containing protein [Syntrophotaleaceae bacterium]